MEEIFNQRQDALVPDRATHGYGATDIQVWFMYLRSKGYIQSFKWRKVKENMNWITLFENPRKYSSEAFENCNKIILFGHGTPSNARRPFEDYFQYH
jgi:hypothetical protein